MYSKRYVKISVNVHSEDLQTRLGTHFLWMTCLMEGINIFNDSIKVFLGKYLKFINLEQLSTRSKVWYQRCSNNDWYKIVQNKSNNNCWSASVNYIYNNKQTFLPIIQYCKTRGLSCMLSLPTPLLAASLPSAWLLTKNISS